MSSSLDCLFSGLPRSFIIQVCPLLYRFGRVRAVCLAASRFVLKDAVALGRPEFHRHSMSRFAKWRRPNLREGLEELPQMIVYVYSVSKHQLD